MSASVSSSVSADVEQARAQIEQAIAGKTVPGEFRDAVAEMGEQPALHWRTAEGWQALSWRAYYDQVRRVAYGLKSLGFAPGAFGTILTRNRPEHLVADLALLFARGVPVSLYTTLAAARSP